MASKKQTKITKAPSGVSFMYEPREAPTETMCPECGNAIEQDGGEFPTCVGHSTFACDECGWCSPSGNFKHEPTTKTILSRKLPIVKKQAQKKQPKTERDAVRAEARKRMARLVKVRQGMPKDSSKLTATQRGKLNRYGFSIVEIREEIKS